eukprot:1293358-Amphidinium_carterae.2
MPHAVMRVEGKQSDASGLDSNQCGQTGRPMCLKSCTLHCLTWRHFGKARRVRCASLSWTWCAVAAWRIFT